MYVSVELCCIKMDLNFGCASIVTQCIIVNCSVLFLRAGVQPTLDPCAEAFRKQAKCASPGAEEFWLMMCANVCVTEG